MEKQVACVPTVMVGTSSEWAAASLKPLPKGGLVFETDTKKAKLGNGTDLYPALPYIIDPTAPVYILANTSSNAITIKSPNLSTGPSDTDSIIKAISSDNLNGWDHRWLAGTGDYQITRTNAGTTTVPMTILKASGQIILGNASPNETVRILANPANINCLRLSGSSADNVPVNITSISTTNGAAANIPIRIGPIGNADFTVYSLSTGRSMFKVLTGTTYSNGITLVPGTNGFPPTFVSQGVSDVNIGQRYMATGNGLFQFASNYPSFNPILQLDARSDGNVFLNMSNYGTTLSINSYPSDGVSPTDLVIFPGGGVGGSVRINGKLGFNTAPVSTPDITGSYTATLDSLAQIVKSMGVAISATGLVTFNANMPI